MQQKLNICAYCRVSTDKTDQINSLINQKLFFEKYISEHENWNLVQIFADEGISGTSTKNRTAFNQMIELSKSGKIDYIITKEVSRFSRNTIDVLKYTRELKSINVGVLFINDNIDTMDSEGEFRLTLMSSLAQEESRKISSRVKWGQQRQMEKGVVFGNGIYGYNLKNGSLTINPAEAETIKLIFSEFLNGKSAGAIAKSLNSKKIPPKKALEWRSNTILNILKNEKYSGNLIQKKYITNDFLDHKKAINTDTSTKLYIENHHEPIISNDTFLKVQEELKKRNPHSNDRKKYSNRHWCSSKIFCGICGKSFVAYTNKTAKGENFKGFRCSENSLHGKLKQTSQGHLKGCNNKIISDKILKFCVSYIFDSISIDKEKLIIQMQNELKNVLSSDTWAYSELEKKLSNLDSKKDYAIDSLLEGKITNEDFLRITDKYNSMIKILNNKLLTYKEEFSNKATNKALENCINYLKETMFSNYPYSESILKCITDKITVFPDKSLIIKLKIIPESFYIKYEATGRGASYSIHITDYNIYKEK